LEESGNATDTIQSRLIFTISPADYLYGAVMPFIGSGFYVSPVNIAYSSKYAFVGDHGETYRVGYGIHNMYLFPFEQGGVVAFILFIMFLLSVHRGLKRACKETSPVNKGLAVGTRAFFYAMLIIGIGGQVFWNFDGNGNLLVYLIMTFMISTSIPTPAYQLIRPQDRGMLEMAQYSPRFAAAESTRAVAGR
jgi:hypothetical protein